MIEYVLDTDICIYWLKGSEAIKRKVKQIGPDSLRTTIFTLAELKYGAFNSHNVRTNLQNIQSFLSKVVVLNFDEDAAEKFGKIKADLRKQGQLIEDFDILIASSVLSHGGTLVTNNVTHFKRIPELNYENWLQE